MADFPGAPLGTGQTQGRGLFLHFHLIPTRREAAQRCWASSTQRMVGLSACFPHCRRNPRRYSRFEAVRRFSFGILSRKDLAGFIVHFSGGKTPKILPYWTAPSILQAQKN